MRVDLKDVAGFVDDENKDVCVDCIEEEELQRMSRDETLEKKAIVKQGPTEDELTSSRIYCDRCGDKIR